MLLKKVFVSKNYLLNFCCVIEIRYGTCVAEVAPSNKNVKPYYDNVISKLIYLNNSLELKRIALTKILFSTDNYKGIGNMFEITSAAVWENNVQGDKKQNLSHCCSITVWERHKINQTEIENKISSNSERITSTMHFTEPISDFICQQDLWIISPATLLVSLAYGLCLSQQVEWAAI